MHTLKPPDGPNSAPARRREPAAGAARPHERRRADQWPALRVVWLDAVAALRVAAVGVAVDLDLLARDVLGHGALLGLDVLVEAHALLGHDALLGDRLLRVEHDLVLLLGQLGAGRRIVDVRVRD